MGTSLSCCEERCEEKNTVLYDFRGALLNQIFDRKFDLDFSEEKLITSIPRKTEEGNCHYMMNSMKI